MILCKVSKLPCDAAEPNGRQLEQFLLDALGPEGHFRSFVREHDRVPLL